MAEFQTPEALPSIPVDRRSFAEQTLHDRLTPGFNAGYCINTNEGIIISALGGPEQWLAGHVHKIVPAVRDFAEQHRTEILKLAPQPSEYADKPLRQQQAQFCAVIVEKLLAHGFGWNRRMQPVTDAFPNTQRDEWFALVCVHLWNKNDRVLVNELSPPQDEATEKRTATIRKLRSLLPEDTIAMFDDGTDPKEMPDQELLCIVLAMIRMVQVLPTADIDSWHCEAMVEIDHLRDL